MILGLKIGLWYVAAWLLSLMTCAILSKVKSGSPTCRCGDDYRVERKELAAAMLILLPLSMPYIFYIVVKAIHHKRGCLVKLIGDV